MSPNEQKMTPGREAMAWARSIISSGVTHTGQPGPWTGSTPAGISRSMPYFTMVWVWPPHTSIRVQGRVTQRAMAATSCSALAPSRYSSRYFMGRVLLQSPLAPWGRGAFGGSCQCVELIHAPEKLQDPRRFVLVDPRQGEANHDQYVVA